MSIFVHEILFIEKRLNIPLYEYDIYIENIGVDQAKKYKSQTLIKNLSVNNNEKLYSDFDDNKLFNKLSINNNENGSLQKNC